jgi:hypothetical protein
MTRPDFLAEALAAWARFPLIPQASFGLSGSISRAMAARRRNSRPR